MTIFSELSHSVSKIGLFWQDKFNGTVFRWNLLFLAIQGVIIFIKFGDLPPQIPLFYSKPWGSPQLANSTQIFLLPGLSFAFLVINNFLATKYLKSVPLLSKLLVLITLVFTAYCAYTIYNIVSLIT